MLRTLILPLIFCCSGVIAQGTYQSQPAIEARTVEILHEDQLRFKDLNKNGKLDVYEDWRQSVESRIEDLISQMSLEEKAGMMLINTLNANEKGKLSERAVEFVEDEKMTRFIFRNTITENPDNTNFVGGNPFRSAQITPFEAAQLMLFRNLLKIPDLAFRSCLSLMPGTIWIMMHVQASM